MSPAEDLGQNIEVRTTLATIEEKDSNESLVSKEAVYLLDAVVPLEEKLDRQKLKAAHAEIMLQKAPKAKKNDLLNRNLLKHFKVKKVYRAFSPEAVEMMQELRAKYREALSQLDEAIACGKQVATDCNRKLVELELAKRTMADSLDSNVNGLELEIRIEGLKLKSSQTGHYLQEEVVNRLLKVMGQVRASISTERLIFIKTLDKHTEIDQKAKSLEDLGNGLRMIDFEQLRAERQSLGDKIEDRNNELAKLHLRCYSDTQILAHVREKEFMLDNVIAKESLELGIVARDMTETRNYANRINVERDSLRKQFSAKSDLCGLLKKPALLSDYDQIVKCIADRKQLIVKLQISIDKMSKQIAELMAKTFV